MIYCPHCQRPTARETGQCPHCGGNLDAGQASLPVGGIPPAALSPPNSEYEPPPEGEGGVRASGLELAVAPSRSVAAAPLHQAQVAEESGVIEKLAGFPEPESGLVGAARYYFAVKRRIKKLDAEHREAANAAAEALERRRQNLVALGRLAHTSQMSAPGLKPLFDRALVAEGELQGCLRQKEGLERSHDIRRGQLEEELEQVRENSKPVRDRREEALKKLAEAEKKSKGVAVQKKRIDIDLRNRDELIAKRKNEYEASPQGEARQKILAEINALDGDRPALILRRDGLGVYLEEGEEKCEKLRAELGAVEGELKKAVAAEEAVAEKIAALEQSFAQKNQKVAKTVAAERAKAEAAWVTVADEVIASRVSSSAIDPIVQDVAEKKRLADEHALKTNRLERARSTYDKEAYAKGKRNLVLAGAALAALIAGIVALVVLI